MDTALQETSTGPIDWAFDIYAWISELSPGQWVLDLASGPGSFPNSAFPCRVVAVDEDLDAFGTASELPPGLYFRVFGTSKHLPFSAGSFDLVICHHSLEHISALPESLSEIARVLKPGGRFYAAIPNGYGLCDAVYRYLFEGGGHVNRFRREQVADLIEQQVGLRLVRWQYLYSSFIYLRRLIGLLGADLPDLSPRLKRLRPLPRRAISLSQWLLYLGTRLTDLLFRTNLSIYGWAMYFERSSEPAVQEPGYPNVCLYCGSGHHAKSIERQSWYAYRCRDCNSRNPYFPPFRNTR